MSITALFTIGILLLAVPDLSGQNLVPNYDFSSGQPGRTPYCVNADENINNFILGWKRALNAEAIACSQAFANCPTPDWVDVGCFGTDIYPIMPENRWIHSVEGGGYAREGVRTELSHSLTPGETYTVTYWTASRDPIQNHDFRVYLCNWGKYWDQQPFWANLGGRNRILVDVFSEPIVPHISEVIPSPFEPMARNWHQRRAEFTVPSDMDDLKNIILISRDEYHEFDDVVLTQGGCDDPLIIDNTTFRPGVHHPYYGTPIQIGYNGQVNSEDAILTFVSPIEVQINEANVPGHEAFHVYNAPCECESPVVNAGSNVIICDGNPSEYQLGLNAQEWMSYEWGCDPPSGLNYLSSTTVSNPILTPPSSGFGHYKYTLTVTNTCGESLSEEVMIVIGDETVPDPTLVNVTLIIPNENGYLRELLFMTNQYTEQVIVEVYENGVLLGGEELLYDAFIDFTPGGFFDHRLPFTFYGCDDYEIRIRAKNFCNPNWSNTVLFTEDGHEGAGVIDELSNVIWLGASPPHNSITLYHSGFVSYSLDVYDNYGMLIHKIVDGAVASNPLVVWNESMHNQSAWAANPGATMYAILTLNDCDGNSITETSYWTILGGAGPSSGKLDGSEDPTEENQGDISETEQIHTLFQERIKIQKLTILPNPNSGKFTVFAASLQLVAIKDASGRLVKQINAKGRPSIQIDGLSQGVYIVQAQMTNGSIENAKVVVR